MASAPAPSFSGLLGYRRSRWNFLGGQVRLATIRDGTLRVVDASGDEVERVLSRLHDVPKELRARAAAEPAVDIEIGLSTAGPLTDPKAAADLSRQTFDALIANGARTTDDGS